MDINGTERKDNPRPSPGKRSTTLPRVLISLLRPSKQQVDRTDYILKLVQVLAIVVSGVWVLSQYLAFERESKALELKIAALTIEDKDKDVALKQIQALYADQEQRLTLAQKGLDVKLAGLAIDEKGKEVYLKGIEAQYAQDEKDLAEKLANLSVASKSQEVTRQNLQLSSLEKAIFDETYDLSISKIEDLKDGRSRYDATVDLSIKNNSSNTDVELSAIVIELFEGRLPDDEARSDASALEVSLPPDIFNINTKSEIVWKKIKTTGYAYPGALPEMRDNRYIRYWKIDLQSGGPLIGRWAPGQSYDATFSYIVTSSSKAILGACINVITNRAKDQRDSTYLKLSRQLWSIK